MCCPPRLLPCDANVHNDDEDAAMDPDAAAVLDVALNLFELERRSPFEQMAHDEVGMRLDAEDAAGPKPAMPSRDELQASVGDDVDLDDHENLEWVKEQWAADQTSSRSKKRIRCTSGCYGSSLRDHFVTTPLGSVTAPDVATIET
jgi:hypothetical protein